MKATYTLLSFLIVTALSAQTDTEIYLFDIYTEEDKTELSNGKNISNSKGYDSQPFFLGKDALVYAGERDGNAEIIKYTKGKESIFNTLTNGGEYSPQPIPNGRGMSAVRLDPNGDQRLYSYTPRSKKTEELIKESVVAYYAWADATTIVAADIVDNNLTLVIHDLATGSNTDLGITVGRSFHKIPGTQLISFIDKTNEFWSIKSINPKTQEIKEIASLFSPIEDIAWLPDGSLLATKDNIIFVKKENQDWTILKKFEDENLKDLSRIAVSPDGSQLAVVSSASIGAIVDAHIKPFNDRDLDAFANAFSQDVVVRNYFDDTLYVGRNRLKSNYKRYFENTPSSQVKVLNRMIYDKYVVDHEEATVNGKTRQQATVYEVSNGKIASMSFIQASSRGADPVPVVDEQIKTYNKGDLDGFMELYTDNISFYRYPTTLAFKSREDASNEYGKLFKELPDLNVVINNRIVIGSIVIDHEKLSADGNTWYAIVINEVKDDKVNRVTFF